MFRTKFVDHLLLLVTTVNGNDSKTHCFCVLAGKGTKTSTSANNSDVLPWASSRFLQSFVDCNTCTENWSNGVKLYVFGYSCNMGGLGNTVLLESSIDGVA